MEESQPEEGSKNGEKEHKKEEKGSQDNDLMRLKGPAPRPSIKENEIYVKSSQSPFAYLKRVQELVNNKK